MSTPSRPRIVKDSRGQTKLKLSLPGGRYQLSLDDRGINLLFDTLGYDFRDTVPDLVVRVLVATGDAWFPHQRDSRKVIEDMPETSPIGRTELAALAEYLRTNSVTRNQIELVRDVVAETALSERVSPDEIDAKELPNVPEGIFEDTAPTTVDSRQTPESPVASSDREHGRSTGTSESLDDAVLRLKDQTEAGQTELEERLRRLDDHGISIKEASQVVKRQFSETSPEPDIFDIPGVGTVRGYNLIAAGLDSVELIADSRPSELTELPNFNEDLATTAVEGARELIGNKESTATQLAHQTGVSEARFDSALSQLAAAGVPPSAAAPTLRQLYGPSIIQVDSIDGRMAYFLWEAGYTTPWELAQASIEELESVDYIGAATAEKIIDDAETLVQ